MNEKLASEKVILSSSMSFSGSRARIWRITGVENVWLKWLLLIPLAVALIFFTWCFVLVWYVFFGLWLVPYRLFRRGQRKDKKRELQHRELLEQLENHKIAR